MKILSSLWFSLRALFSRRRADDELDEELAYHIEREAELYEQRGMSRDEARREAVRRFGGVQRHREASRDVRRLSWLDDLGADLRFAFRLLRLYPLFSINVIGIAALGIAACATTFSLVSGILLSPLPFSEEERVFELQLAAGEQTSAALPIESYLRLEREPQIIEAIAASSPGGAAVEWNGEPERIRYRRVTPSFLRVFGVQPILGRPFAPDEGELSTPVVLLGYDTWRTRFAGDSAVMGRALALDGVPHTIIGVMPPRFRAHYTVDPELWVPMSVSMSGGADGRNTFNAVLRSAPGVTRSQLEAWLSTNVRARIASRTTRDSVDAAGMLIPIKSMILGNVDRPLKVLLGAVILVLLLVAANVATMFLARTAARNRELGLRRALGASRWRQLRQLVTESATLTVIGGLVGVIASYWAVAGIRGLGVRVLPRMDAVALDWRVLLFAIAGTVLTAVIGGIAPALASRKVAELRDGAGAGSRITGQQTSSALVVVQIVLSVVLLTGAGLLMKSFLRVSPDDPGFATENRAAIVVALRGLPSFPDTDRVATRGFVRDVSAAMRRLSGVRDVAVMSFAPFFGSVSTAEVEIPGRPVPDRPINTYQNIVTPNFFDVMRIPIRRGRAFTVADVEGAEPVVIINETAAARWWPDSNALGRQLTLSNPRMGRVTVTIVGVAGDGRLMGTDTKIRPEIYLAVDQQNPRFLTFIAHTSVPPGLVARDLQRAVWSVAPRLPIGTSSDLATIANDSVRRERFFSWAMGTFAAVAIVLSALAVYGLLAFAVVQRRQEIGIRMALGATSRGVGVLVLRRAIGLAIAGVIPGVLLARALSRFMASLLLEVSATDATVFLATGVGVLAVALLAACAPSYQAARVDPMESLRT